MSNNPNLHNQYWKPGESGNPNGRPSGSRNKRTQEILNLLQERGDKDPLDFLSEVITSNNHYSPELKVSAANYLTPYLHSKRSVAAPAPRYIDSPVQVPEFTSIDQAEAFLASLPVLLGRGELDSQTALELSTLTRAWISARHEREELQLKIQSHGGLGDQTIRIEGGLPALPGTNIIMPERNQDLNGNTIDHDPASSLPAPDADRSDPEPQAEDPTP
jgi:hypothetical protein